MTLIRRQQIVSRVTIGGVETAHAEIHTSHGTDQPIGTANLVLALPLPSQVEPGAPVVCEAGTDGDFFVDSIFQGTVAPLDREAAARLKSGRLACVGHHYRLSHPLVRDVAYAGGAGTMPALLVGAPRHLGDNTIGNYAVPVPEGTSFDATWEPAVDSDFIRLTGKLHGTNNDLGDTDALRMTHFDRVEIRQGGVLRGWAILPAHTDDLGADYDVVEEFGDVGVWADFDITIAARLTEGGGTATARFISGYPPGGGRGDHEVQQVRRSTAAKNTAREVIRGFYKRAGMGGVSGISYVVDEIKSYSGVIIELGGNGFVDNGQVRFRAGEQPLRAVQRVAGPFRYSPFDSPDGVCRVRGVRGAPDPLASVATFTEVGAGRNLLSARQIEDPGLVVNYWRVEGASGTDANGARFAYLSIPDVEDLPEDEADWRFGRISDSLLTSDDLCLYAGNLHEADFAEIPVMMEWEATPRSIQPGRVVTVNAPSVDYSGSLWLTGIRHDLAPRDYRCAMTGWAGTGSPIAESPDPNPSADDLTPGDPQGDDVWRPYVPRAA